MVQLHYYAAVKKNEKVLILINTMSLFKKSTKHDPITVKKWHQYTYMYV